MLSPALASSSQSGAPNRRPTHNPKSNLAGITFETSHGRFVCLFWQSTTGDIWQSRFLVVARSSKWELWSTVLVARGAKQETPLAAVTWANGLKQSVFFLDDSNIIHERLSTDSGQTWEDGSLNNMTIGVGSKSKLAAAADSPLQDNITLKVVLYYQDRWDEIRQLRYLHDPLCMVTGAENFRDRWTPGSRCSASPIKGSSIAAGLDYKVHKASWIYYVLPSGAGGQANWPTDITKTLDQLNYYGPPLQAEAGRPLTLSLTLDAFGRQACTIFSKGGEHEMVSQVRFIVPGGWGPVSPLRDSETVGMQFIALEWEMDGCAIVNLLWLQSPGGMKIYDVSLGRIEAPVQLI